MRYWTWGEIRTKIEDEFDLQEEPDILSPGELMGYINDAIDACEQHFIGMGDYFLATSTITLVPGQRDYDLPDDIYATKIRKLISDFTEVMPVKDLNQVPFLAEEVGNACYKYLLINTKGSKPVIRLLPTPRASGSMDIFYTRNANRLLDTGDDSQEVDIPEAMLWIMEYVRMKLYDKERQYQKVADSQARLEKFEEMLLKALSARVDDENNTVDPDVSIYWDQEII